MAELSNIRNTGVVVGGSVTRSTISVTHSGQAGGTDESEVLRELDARFAELLGAVLQLPAEQVAIAARETAELKEAVHAPRRDPKRIRSVLDGLKGTVATAAPLVEIVKDIAELVTSLLR